MTTETDTRELAENFAAALHALQNGDDGALERICALFEADALITNAALDLSGQAMSGPQGVHDFWGDYRGLFSEVRTEFHQITASDEAAGLFWTSKGKAATSGEPFEYQGASLLVFDGDQKISAFRGYFDTRALTLQA